MNEIAVYPHKTCIFALEKSCLTSKLMYNTEVRTITKSLPLLR